MRANEEIANLSDDALRLLNIMFNEQYKLGFEYAYRLTINNDPSQEFKDLLKSVLVPLDPEYLRTLILNRK